MLGWFGFGHFFVVRVLLGITGAFSWALVGFGQFKQDLSFGNGGPTVSSGGCSYWLGLTVTLPIKIHFLHCIAFSLNIFQCISYILIN